MSLIENLAQIRELQGKEPLPSPHHIQGFEPGSPPVPEYRPMPQDEDPFGLDDDIPAESTLPQSPLIPRKRTPAGDAMPAPITAPQIDLMVANRIGVWKGREITLTEKEEKQVRAVVLKAIQRELAVDLRDAGVQRVPRAKAAPEAVSSDPPKRRGRPRKVQP